ncbi:hypothetical protein CKM354_000688300 [Cercospora kikuchii]|uniref:Uncharacterized protein n=1 Tax=Cercospora kikuchii TaxID=84275 RepID=A0A9P3FDS2_9PEZI|nr:uncharacterized protein CKM354_000688300 [Cercospora kikuchii]GIZ43666.1 hypothetical protein CKM354_000688300 [Cercospora kikuchii]
MSSNHIIVIIGASGIGLAAARRIAGNRTLFLGARSQSTLNTAKDTLTDEGFEAVTHEIKISSLESVRTFAAAAASHGIIDVVVHTSGVSPSTATSVEEVIQVDLLGTAYVIDAFLEYASEATSVICVSSSAAHMGFAWPTLSASLQRHLALAQCSELLSHEDYQNFEYAGPQSKVLWAYWFAKYSNLLRVQGAAIAYGKKDARINSISPGLTMTKMGRAECEGENGEGMKAMMESSPIKRAATPYDVANAIAFLAGSDSSYITGSDLKIDGGVVSSMRWEVLNDGLPADDTGA